MLLPKTIEPSYVCAPLVVIFEFSNMPLLLIKIKLGVCSSAPSLLFIRSVLITIEPTPELTMDTALALILFIVVGHKYKLRSIGSPLAIVTDLSLL